MTLPFLPLRLLATMALGLSLASAHAVPQDRYLRQMEVAIEHGQLAMVERLLNARPTLVVDKDPIGNTSLHYAAMYGQTRIATVLIKRGAKVNGRNQNRRTPLHYVYTPENKTEAVAALLIRYSADVNVADVEEKTPLHRAAGAGSARLVKLLVQSGAKLDPRNDFGETPLHWACASGSTETVTFLLFYSADLHAVDAHGENSLHHAAKSEDGLPVVKLLLSRGLKVDARGGIADQTPLFFAAKRGLLPTARYLISKGANVNSTDDFKMTPLLEAAQNGRLEMAKFLLAKGANIDAVNIQDRTAEMLAERYDYPELAKFFRNFRHQKSRASTPGLRRGEPSE